MISTNPQPQRGATLLEVMLVLSISGLGLVMGVKLYQSYEDTLQLLQVKYNVDQLFEATANYFKANCAAGDFSPKPPSFMSPYPVNTGTITYPPSSTAYFPVSIVSTLQANGYLDNWHPNNPDVDASVGESGYIVQLNPMISTNPLPVNACVVVTPGTACKLIKPTSTSSIPSSQAVVVTWAIQVAVKPFPASKIKGFGGVLGADCLSDSSSAGTVDSCAASNATHNYMVWSRLPSQAMLQKNSVFTTSMLMLKQYNLQYTHDSNYEFNQGYTTAAEAPLPTQAPVYYLCGG